MNWFLCPVKNSTFLHGFYSIQTIASEGITETFWGDSEYACGKLNRKYIRHEENLRYEGKENRSRHL
jgi:hypothetical protein